ncbi:MAG: sulfotransferase family protein [Magnetospiraceae bacterium]
MTAMVKPVFMFGMDRSGTTLLSMVVGAHPQIGVPHATANMWFQFADRLEKDFNDLQTETDLIALVDAVLAHERVGFWNTDLDRCAIQGNARIGDFGSVVAATHLAYAQAHGKPYWANMDIGTLEEMHRVNRWIPDARFLHIIRDGRDVALSHQTMPYGAGNIAECAEAWVSRLSTNLRMGDILGPDRYLAIRYEDLVLQPQETLSRICTFCGLDFDPEMLEFGKTVENRVPKEKMWLWPGLDGPLQASKVDRWRREMSQNQRIVFEMTAGPLLRELGYEAYQNPPKKLMAYGLELLYFLGRGGRWKRLLEKFGVKRESQLERNSKVKEST